MKTKYLISNLPRKPEMFDIEEYQMMKEDEQYKEVYARFGLCIFHFQMLEHQLINMILSYYKMRNMKMNQIEYKELFHSYSDSTMGKLIQVVNDLYNIEDPMRKELWIIHKERNYFAHHYFKDKSFMWDALENRICFITEIDLVDTRTRDMDKQLTEMERKNLASIGITQEIID